jgi:hypothetical protein
MVSYYHHGRKGEEFGINAYQGADGLGQVDGTAQAITVWAAGVCPYVVIIPLVAFWGQ